MSDIFDTLTENKDIFDEISSQPNKQLKSIFPQLPEQMKFGRFAQRAGQDVLATPAHFFNQLLLDYPRQLTEEAGYEYPSEAPDKAFNVPAYAAGVVGGIKNPLFKALKITPKSGIGKLSLAGGLTGATYSPQEFESPEQVVKEQAGKAAFGALLPFGGKVVGSVAKKASNIVGGAGQFVIKNVGGVTESTQATIKRLGAVRVFDPLKEQADYIGKTLMPNVISKIQSFDDEVQEALTKHFKIPKEIIQNLKQAGVKTIDELREKADKAYAEAVKIDPKGFGKTIDIRKTLKTIEGVFKGSLGEATRGPQGNRLLQIMNELRSRKPAPKGFYADKVPTKTELLRQFKGEKLTDIEGEVRISKKQFMEIRDALNSLYRENPYDRNVGKTIGQLYADAETAGMKGIGKARALQRIAFDVEGSKFGKTLEGLSDPIKLERDLASLKNPEKFNLREAYKSLIGKNNYDDLEAHFANRDFGLVSNVPGTGGGIFTGRSGLVKTAVSQAAKKYYKDIEPAIGGLKGQLTNIGTRGFNRLNQFMQEPYLSEQGRKQIGGKGGFASFSKPTESIFDLNTTGMDYYDNLFGKTGSSINNVKNITQKEYYAKFKNKTGEIIMMSPNEYLGKIKKADISKNSMEKIDKAVKAGSKLPIPMLDYSGDILDQEGRHRATYALQNGINKIPVLVVKKVNNLNKEFAVGGILAGGLVTSAQAQENVDMNKIYQIESSNNPSAFNRNEMAVGLGQIRQAVITDWNKKHPKEKYTLNDMFDAEKNKKVSNWYMNDEIPRMLRVYKKSDTLRNRIIAYNAGIGYVKNNKPIPERTKKYLLKYGIKK